MKNALDQKILVYFLPFGSFAVSMLLFFLARHSGKVLNSSQIGGGFVLLLVGFVLLYIRIRLIVKMTSQRLERSRMELLDIIAGFCPTYISIIIILAGAALVVGGLGYIQLKIL